MVSRDEAEIAKGITLRIMPRIPVDEEVADSTLEAPHFVLYVQDELERLYGADAITRGGWQITTSLDMAIQETAETAVRDQVAARAVAHNVSNGSVVVLKPGTGEILALVGSLDYFDEVD